MNEGFDFQTFGGAVEATAAPLAGRPADQEHLAEVARAVQEHAEITLARHLRQDQLIACGPGCGHCCVLNVSLLLPEIHAICRYLKSRHKKTRLQRLHRAAVELDRKVGCLNDEERAMTRQACLFLDEAGSCSVYPVRPLLCRAVTSTDPQQCRDALAMVALGEPPTIVSHLFQQRLFNETFLALGRALAHAGIDSRSWRLVMAMRSFLPAYL